MLQLIFWSVLLAAATGLGLKYILDYSRATAEITWTEFSIGMAAICVVLIPGTAKLGWEVSRSNLIQYNEYWNGWELRAIKEDIKCERDGWCVHEYDCDPYIEMESYSCNCDKKGNCSTCYRPVTKYHDCPYVTVESNYRIETTLGTFDIQDHRLVENAQANRWRKSVSVPQSVISQAGEGPHPFWLAAKQRIESGDPGPVTKRMPYRNYILASDSTILKTYSSDIERFQKANLLPKLATEVHTYYLADKVYFVGYNPQDAQAWQAASGRLDAALGTELQGDLHLVVTQNQEINNNPDAYVLALKPYWQNKNVFGQDAFAKNGIGVVIGTVDGQNVAWERAFTGMPIGNEDMVVAIQYQLKGVPLNPESVIGVIRGQVDWSNSSKPKVTGLHGSGTLETVLWGGANSETKFRRFSMEAKDPADIGGGYLYLMGEIQPTGSQKFWIGFFCFIACSGVWVACIFIGERSSSSDSQLFGQRRYNRSARTQTTSFRRNFDND